jgi:hypothetical protein
MTEIEVPTEHLHEAIHEEHHKAHEPAAGHGAAAGHEEIGRASCRERVYMPV